MQAALGFDRKAAHSLGKLEDALVGFAGMTGNERIHLVKKALVVMCADNGVVEEGVTQSGQEVTAIVSENMLSGKATSSHYVPIDRSGYLPGRYRNRKRHFSSK